MPSATNPIPPGFRTLTPYLTIKDAARAIDFYKKAFGAVEKSRMTMPDGRVGHAELEIGDSKLMLSDEFPDFGARSPQALGGSPVGFYIYVPDVDAAAKRAVGAGATEVMPVKDQFYGDRSGKFTDPFGHIWNLATHKEDVPPDELKRRFEAMCKGK